jgi:hypothetical protein
VNDRGRVAHRAALVGIPVGVFGGGLALRLVLAFVVFPGTGHSGDLGFFSSWAATLASSGPGTFYATSGSANYPPGFMYVLWLIGALGGPAGGVLGVSADRAILLLIKVPAILADLAIALLLWRAGRRWFGERVGLGAAALYLFVPVTWYDSAIWGQVDAVGALFAFGAIVLLIEGRSEAAVAAAILGVIVKPQAAIALVIVLPVLIRRHLLARDASGARGQGGGPVRLATAALAGTVALIVPLLPFDITRFAPASLADVPVIGHVAGLLGLFVSVGGQYTVLTANAYNAWALVGPNPLTSIGAGGFNSWTADSITVLGLPAAALGAGLLAAVGLLVAGGLLRWDGRLPILLGLAVVALAFYALPTRVHERYLVPFFAPAALLAAASIPRAAAYLGLGGLNLVNIHAALVGGGMASSGGFGGAGRGGGGPGGGFGRGGPGSGSLGSSATQASMPFGDLASSPAAVTLVAVGQTVAFILLLGAWVVLLVRPWAFGGNEAEGRGTTPSNPGLSRLPRSSG